MEYNRQKKILGLNIKAERMRRDLTQFDLSGLINLTESSISNIECGYQVPSALVLYDIAKVFGIEVDELFKGLD